MNCHGYKQGKGCGQLIIMETYRVNDGNKQGKQGQQNNIGCEQRKIVTQSTKQEP